MYTVLGVFYFVSALVWLGFYIRYRESLMGLQHMTTVVLAVAFAECLLWMIDYYMYNSSGLICTDLSFSSVLDAS